MTYFISYDVADSKRRYKVVKVLEDFGIRIQYSFFECEFDYNGLENFRRRILEEIKLDEDSLRIYPLCSECLKKTESIGKGNIYIPNTFEIL